MATPNASERGASGIDRSKVKMQPSLTSDKPYRIGYLTGTFDIMHTGHYELLQYAKRMCDQLIVGVTSDERAAKRKRTTALNWHTRFHHVRNCQWVDDAVPDTGQPKELMCDELHFDVLFTTDDYRGSAEYVDFAQARPHVPVHYVPRPPSGESSSNLTSRITRNMLENLEYLAVGVNGKLMHVPTPTGRVVIKEVQMGVTEYFDPHKTSNVYRLPFPNVPRNWKGVEGAVYPNISGVNSRREIDIQQFINDCPWNPVYAVQKKYTYHTDTPPDMPEVFDIARIQNERARPTCVYWILQHHAGIPILQHLKKHPEDEAVILAGVREICDDLYERNIVHGDIHGSNLCVKKSAEDGSIQLSLIDFGWCSHSLFSMDADERKYHDEWLQNGGDWAHFVCSHRASKLEQEEEAKA